MIERATLRTIALLLGMAAASGASAAYSNAEFARVINPKELRIDQLRNKEIDQLRLVLSRNIPQEQQPDMLLRLSELYTEKYRLFFLKETEIWQQKMDAYLQNDISQQKRLTKPILDNGASKQWLNLALKTLERVRGLKTAYSRMDEVDYFLGFNYWEIGHREQAVKNFSEIVERYPNSRYASEAHRYLGDYAFGARDFRNASQHYKKAAAVDTPAKSKVLYGLAWSYFKLKDYHAATNTMRDAIESAKSQGADAASRGIALQRDAYDALALFYTESSEANKAAEYFGSLLGKAESVEVLRKLAALYQRQGRFSQALTVNKELVEMGGAAQKVGDDQRYSILLDSIRVAGNNGDREREAALLKSLVAEFVVKNKSDENRSEQIRQMVRKAALLAHQEANKAKNSKVVYARAEDLYRVYLDNFGARAAPEDVWEIRYLLADALSQQGKNAEAANEFQAVLGAGAPTKKYQKDAALGLIYSLDAAFKDDKATRTTDEANSLVNAIDTYTRLYPNEKDVPKYLARAAGVLVTSKRMEEARPRLEFLAKTYPATKEGLDAAVLLVKQAEESQDWDRVSGLAGQLLASRPLMAQDKNGQLKHQLEDIQSRAKFKEVKQLEASDNFMAAASQYEALAAKSQDREVRYKALNNAAVSYEKAGDSNNELRIYQQILRDFPNDERSAKAILGLANAAFLAGDYANASSYFEKYFLAYESRLSQLPQKKQDELLTSLRTAALLREAMGQGNESAEDLRHIVNAANKGSSVARDAAEDILARQAERARLQGDATTAVRAYQRYLQSFPEGRYAVDANLQAGLLYEKLRDDEKARSEYNKTLQLAKKRTKGNDARAASAAAHARLELLKPSEENFYRMSLRLPESQLKTDIAAKLKAMETLVKGYVEVVDFGEGTWGVEALRRMANAYRNFGESLENAPTPTEFSAEDKAKFKAQLKQVAAPVFQKRNDTLENALKTGESLYVAGPSMARVYVDAALAAALADRLPLAYTTDFSQPDEWLVGDVPSSESELAAKRDALKANTENAAAWVAIGNWHALQNKFELSRVFYLRALEANKRFSPAIANLAYLEGRAGNWQAALAGYRTALEQDEFAIQAKKDLARIYMASGLWRHANLAYRQLEVRAPADKEVKQGLGLSYLALGKATQAEPLLADFLILHNNNARLAKAVLQLAKGNAKEARTQMRELAGQSEWADQILKVWKE